MGDDQVPVYDWHEPLKLIESKSLTPDTDSHERNDQIFKKLKQKGHLRKLAQPVDLNEALSALETLRQSQPHFTAVVDLVRQEMVMSLKRNRPLKLPPILLNGDPGVGKTFFTQALAGLLNMPIRRHSFDSSTTESALTGSDKHWSNTSYGLVFETVCMGEFANAIVLLDELDKASHTYNQNPTAPLHTLLEPITSSQVTDISVCLNFNASHLNWIATANNPARIAAPLRSRFIEFDIQLPTGEQALQVARTVADAVYKEMDLMDFEPVPASIVKLIAHLVPREQGQVLRRAFAGAVDNNRDHITRMDLPADVLIDDIDATGGNATPTFLH
jgi:ATP-dependent Lon protease